MSAGAAHTCIARNHPMQGVLCVGSNLQFQSGGSTMTTGSFIMDDASLHGADQIAAGAEHTCAVVDPAGVFCWGNRGGVGVLGDGQLDQMTNIPQPVETPIEVASVTEIAAAADTTCIIAEPNGTVWCWGGPPAPPLYGSPNAVVLPEPATDISVSPDHACVLLASGQIRCWGDDGAGAVLGTGVSGPTVDTPQEPQLP